MDSTEIVESAPRDCARARLRYLRSRGVRGVAAGVDVGEGAAEAEASGPGCEERLRFQNQRTILGVTVVTWGYCSRSRSWGTVGMVRPMLQV